MKRGAYFLSFLVLINLASATYISGDITVYDNGFVRFDVETDSPIEISELKSNGNRLTGITSSLTEKTKDLWSFSLDLGSYDNIFLDIYLPSNLYSINLIQGNDNILDLENKIISIIDSGDLNFKVSYKLKETKNYLWPLYFLAPLTLVLGFYLFLNYKTKKQRLENILPLINENEHKIIDSLMNAPKRQKELRNALNIPKASFTRYILNLEKKKLIQREGEGKNKIIKLK